MLRIVDGRTRCFDVKNFHNLYLFYFFIVCELYDDSGLYHSLSLFLLNITIALDSLGWAYMFLTPRLEVAEQSGEILRSMPGPIVSR